MPSMALTLPVQRRSPIIVPRRDMVVLGGDSVMLEVLLVESDRPDAAPYAVELVGLGAALTLTVWDTPRVADYGLTLRGVASRAVYTGQAVEGQSGRIDVEMPAGVSNGWAGRLGWSVQLEYDGAFSTLCWGALSVMPGPGARTPDPLLDDNDEPISDDNSETIKV